MPYMPQDALDILFSCLKFPPQLNYLPETLDESVVVVVAAQQRNVQVRRGNLLVPIFRFVLFRYMYSCLLNKNNNKRNESRQQASDTILFSCFKLTNTASLKRYLRKAAGGSAFLSPTPRHSLPDQPVQSSHVWHPSILGRNSSQLLLSGSSSSASTILSIMPFPA